MKTLLPSSALALILAGCGVSDRAQRTDRTPGAADAAATGVAEIVKSSTKGNPIPRGQLPDFVETYDGGRYGTSFFGSNAKRRTGTLLYHAPAAPADVIAFHIASMNRFGFDAGPAQTRLVRNRNETVIEGAQADGRTLSVVVIEQSPTEATVQMNYAVPVS